MTKIPEKIKSFNNKKIAFLGFGLDNQALLKYLDKFKIKAQISICDSRSQKELKKINLKNLKISYCPRKIYNKNLEKFDILFRSPGWPINDPHLKKALLKNKVKNPLNLFFELSPSKKIIGITGSKGKGTTATLIYKILKHNQQRVFLGGNIGISPFKFIDKIKKNDYLVLELSSFQLEDLKYSPRWSIITNLFKEHLAPADPHNPNFHSSYYKYWQAKLNIAKNPDNKYLIVNYKLKNKITKYFKNKKINYFKTSSLPSKLVGEFNKENIAAAVNLAKLLKIPNKKYKEAIANFHNLEHRLQLVNYKNGIKYFDNSFSTTPESTIYDLKSFKNNIILIAGGSDKGANFENLAKAIEKKVKFLILLPGTGTKRIKKELLAIKFPLTKIAEINNFKEAFKIIKKKAQSGDVVLLSTACASFGIFKNYKERGELFKKYAKLK